MKRFISILLLLSIMFTLCSCNKTKDNSSNDSKNISLYAGEVINFDFESETELLKKYPKFSQGETVQIKYDFDCPEYKQLLEKYPIAQIAGNGTELERVIRLVDEYAPRLTHNSDYDNRIEGNAIALLGYALDKPENGINCSAKSKILNDMCLALGIYSRRVFIAPYSSIDYDSHVVNEIFDTKFNKWIMVDMTTDTYFVDENNTPLSILEIRQRGAEGKYLAIIYKGNKTEVKNDSQLSITYIMKNVFFFYMGVYQTYGEKGNSAGTVYFQPEGFDVKKRLIAKSEFILKNMKNESADEESIKRTEESINQMRKESIKIGNTDSLLRK